LIWILFSSQLLQGSGGLNEISNFFDSVANLQVIEIAPQELLAGRPPARVSARPCRWTFGGAPSRDDFNRRRRATVSFFQWILFTPKRAKLQTRQKSCFSKKMVSFATLAMNAVLTKMSSCNS
jgi:hypothetical protein